MEKVAPGAWSRALGARGPVCPSPLRPSRASRTALGAPRGEVQRSITARKCSHGQDSQASWAGSGCPQTGTRAVIPSTHTTAGLGLVRTSWSCFSRGFGVIFSHSYSTRCHMAASELFGCLIGGVDVKAKWGERKYQKLPWGHPAKPEGDSRAHCELSRHAFCTSRTGNEQYFRPEFQIRSGVPSLSSPAVFLPPLPVQAESASRGAAGHPPRRTDRSEARDPRHTRHLQSRSFDFGLCPQSGLVLNVWSTRRLMSLWYRLAEQKSFE